MPKIQNLEMMNLGSGSCGRKAFETLGDHHHHHKPHHFHHLPYEVLLLVLIFCAVSLSTLVLYHWSYYIHLSPNSLAHVYSPNKAEPDAYSATPHGNIYSMAGEGNDLEKLLKKTAFVDRTVIITTLNAAWTSPNSVFDIFLESFGIGNQTRHLLNHLLVVALDQKAYSRCLELHPYCYALHTNGMNFTGEAYFMSSRYLEMMWARIDFLRTVLEKGYNFVFTDADIMWLRNPFLHFHEDAEFQIACDHFYSNSSDLNNLPNGGFTYVKSSRRTIQFYKFWYNAKDFFPGSHDQDVLNKIKFHPYISTALGLQIKFLDTKFYSGFCELSDNVDAVITVHANCCVGLENKIHDLRLVLDVWKEYLSMSDEERSLENLSWGLPQLCGNVGGDTAPDNSTTL
nr:putative nucleotide-diphospho-sugar transferase, nucleotide-diphospho-sugar transferase [Ipomoea batatas]